MPSAEALGEAVCAEDGKKVGELLRAGANPDAGCMVLEPRCAKWRAAILR